ncbi:Sensory box histidine kinase/response regulator [Enhygromyxa salina]|uniref:histidine kinase n=1 Tax=Enhygromyxa salina TaxID=215803 RepID=A0A0C1ZGD5_9BACT|nr:response regulator [Enhygromyxa salina]KIG16679.1 Sensory box histidine kinase/response regulator [Enhygromyxa salina]
MSDNNEDNEQLRRRAGRLRERRPAAPTFSPDDDPATLYEELQLHHIELQLQNEELLASQHEVERSRDRYRRLYDEAPVGYLTLAPNTTILLANLTAADLLGLEHGALIGTPLARHMDQASADLLHAHLQQVIRDGEAHTCELGVIRGNGKHAWMRLESVLDNEDHDANPGRRACKTMFSDVSSRRELQAHLQRAEQIEIIGRLASGVAHEFNNLLMAVLGGATSALLELDGQTRAAQLLRDVKAEAIRGATLTRQLLTLGQYGDDACAVVDVNAVVAQNARILRHTLPEDIGLSFQLGAKNGRVWAQQGQIEQVLANLVLNARHAVSEGGRVKVQTAELTLDEAEAQRLGGTAGVYVTISVVDTGLGMDEETTARLFEPFFTTKSVGEGTGLGMSTVCRIVRGVGGQIEVESELGVGTTVRVLLPLTSRPLAAPTEGAQAPGRGDETVLVVEEEGLVRHTVQNYLSRWGYGVLEAEDGDQALELIRTRPDIDLLLTDMVLPHASGIDLAAAAVGLRPQLPVLFMSAHPKAKLVRERRLSPEAPALQKPFKEDTLLAKVREVLGSGSGPTRAPPAGEMVLLIEDDDLARDAMELLLDDEGYQVLAARDGAQAIAIASEHGEAIDVVVTDFGLPNTSPHELVGRLETLVRPRAIVVLSGRSGADPQVLELLALTTARSSFLEKPIEIEQLVAAIQQLLASG